MKRLSFLFFLVLAACNATPYWKDSPDRPITSTPNILPSSSSTVPKIGWQEYKSVGTVNIRSEPSTSSPTIGILYPGAIVQADCNRTDEFCEVAGGYVIQACLGVGTGKCRGK